tara:strand:- start:131 stop:901 length:771 start_codon:yes stop_codon:yes gene_type:complete
MTKTMVPLTVLKSNRKDQPSIAVDESGDRKLSKSGQFSGTYKGETSCPSSCPLLGKGDCYKDQGPVKITTKRLDNNCVKFNHTALELCQIEADQIKFCLSGRYPLRVGITGDSPSPECAKITGKAMFDYQARSGQPAFTFTHSHKADKENVTYTDWQYGDHPVNILASVESVDQIPLAKKQGYPSCAVIVEKFQSNKAYKIGNEIIIPCPHQTSKGKITCEDCMLCPKVHKLKGKNIGFEAKQEKLKKTIRGICSK